MNLIHVIYGTNTIRIEEQATQLAEDYLGETDEFSLVSLNYRETSVEAIIEEAQTLPFLSDRKAIIINDAFLLTGSKVKSDVEHNIDLFLDYIQNKNDDTLMIFKVFNEQLDKRKKLTKLMMKEGAVTEIREMTETEIKDFIKKLLRDEGMDIGDRALGMFLERTGVNYSNVKSELAKVMLYAEEKITEEDVADVVSTSMEQNIFQLTEFVLNGRKEEAVKLVRQLILQKNEPIQLLHLIISQFRLLYQVKLLAAEGFAQDYMAKQLKVHPYRVKLALREAKKHRQGNLEEKMVMCRNMDYKFKSSYLDRDTLFELFIMEI
ncbi:DNA polymerase III subunit delta [Lacicoccus alkaliphilus]|uniref:DNA polymerase III subunit delta n=1 Tax=Lacicoccus alkaliphilus DSM 16010 TaxID=1123231 RepID=A0A1M7BNE9_9BACL|nr:DNA polymerase III subunit delta [Salinicoccus alkaliphilus]SHL56386.1 DNA polymerase III, delta subunit [Salinicoccus alkaliphilus DSM 16010]